MKNLNLVPNLAKHENVTSKAITTEKTGMTYDFFADKEDKLEILEYIFKKTDLRVYDLSSLPGQEICEYKSTNEISEKFDLDNGDKFANTFQLWEPNHQGKPIFNKIILDPKYCNGNKFRFSTEGWGLIQLYLGGIKNNELHHSHIGHFSERGAVSWESTNETNGKVNLWNWKEIQSTSSKLKYIIHDKFSIRKIDSFGVLKGADKLSKNGVILR